MIVCVYLIKALKLLKKFNTRIIRYNIHTRSLVYRILRMFKNLFLCVLVLVFATVDAREYDDSDGRSRVWTRIPENGINHKMYRYLAEQDITNCYEFQEQPRLLRLRCQSLDRQIFDVDIIVYPGFFRDSETHNKSTKLMVDYTHYPEEAMYM